VPSFILCIFTAQTVCQHMKHYRRTGTNRHLPSRQSVFRDQQTQYALCTTESSLTDGCPAADARAGLQKDRKHLCAHTRADPEFQVPRVARRVGSGNLVASMQSGWQDETRRPAPAAGQGRHGQGDDRVVQDQDDARSQSLPVCCVVQVASGPGRVATARGTATRLAFQRWLGFNRSACSTTRMLLML
jgi:hypothetical protein